MDFLRRLLKLIWPAESDKEGRAKAVVIGKWLFGGGMIGAVLGFWILGYQNNWLDIGPAIAIVGSIIWRRAGGRLFW